MKVVFSERARADLNDIGEWIASDDPRRAVTFVRELRTVCERIGDFPNAYAALEDMPEVRHRAYRKYRIYFGVANDSVQIIAIRHGARDAFQS